MQTLVYNIQYEIEDSIYRKIYGMRDNAKLMEQDRKFVFLDADGVNRVIKSDVRKTLEFLPVIYHRNSLQLL